MDFANTNHGGFFDLGPKNFLRPKSKKTWLKIDFPKLLGLNPLLNVFKGYLSHLRETKWRHQGFEKKSHITCEFLYMGDVPYKYNVLA